jgi:hypothetical protein
MPMTGTSQASYLDGVADDGARAGQITPADAGRPVRSASAIGNPAGEIASQNSWIGHGLVPNHGAAMRPAKWAEKDARGLRKEPCN